ncbi:IS30 family transposase [Metamycoplasma alkalescens]|uniref:IS30 family transposase n=3 Tax=Metamycoplasma alkalescens TaxID=45363 RepID=A0A318U9F3_9BACT|nr:IS30 family transposase [Metamycoplasma alkalescens]PYF43103.1 IS30 family transposase [Metamycoplasma alkalescens]
MNYTKYKHLSYDERVIIETLFEQGGTISHIARVLNRSKSTISREIKRNTNYNGIYSHKYSQYKYIARRNHKHFFKFTINNVYDEFTKIFKRKYDKRYYGIKATHHYIISNKNIKCPSLRTVFNWIKTNKWEIKKRDRLRTSYKKGGKRTSSVYERLLQGVEYVFPIWTRDKTIDLREEFGHWEADLIIGKRATGYDNILTLTERKSRFGVAIKVKSKNPMTINATLKNLIKNNNLYVKTITIDNGIEFEKIGILAKWLNIKIYRAEPYSSFQRGSNENWNGLIRRQFKKSFDFNAITNEELQAIVLKVNNMPREIFGWKSSEEIYFNNLY